MSQISSCMDHAPAARSCACCMQVPSSAHMASMPLLAADHAHPHAAAQVLCDVALFDGDLMRWTPPLPTPHFLCAHSSVALPLPAPPAPAASALGDPIKTPLACTL